MIAHFCFNMMTKTNNNSVIIMEEFTVLICSDFGFPEVLTKKFSNRIDALKFMVERLTWLNHYAKAFVSSVPPIIYCIIYPPTGNGEKYNLDTRCGRVMDFVPVDRKLIGE